MFWLNDPSVASPLSSDNLSRAERYLPATAGLNGDFYVNIGNVKSATNLITNGDFSSGTTGWVGIGAVVGGVAEYTAVAQYGSFYFPLPNPTALRNHQLYVRALVNTQATNAGLNVTDGITATSAYPTVSNTMQQVSLVKTVGATATLIYVKLADNRTSGWTKMFADNFLCLDLTALYGAGNEPTKSEMDTIMSQFSNSWFNGTQVLYPLPLAANDIVRIAFPAATNGASNARLSVDGGTTYKNIKLSTIRIASEVQSKNLSFVYDGTDFVPLEVQFFPIDFTPTAIAASGTLTSYTSIGNYIKVGRLVTYNFTITITNKGTGASILLVSTPFTPVLNSIGGGMETIATGKALNIRAVANDGTIYVTFYDSTTAIATNNIIRGTINYFV